MTGLKLYDCNICWCDVDRLRDMLTHEEWLGLHLVVAGGYDERVKENTDHYNELLSLAGKSHILISHVSDVAKKNSLW